jgi:hypothetical protein
MAPAEVGTRVDDRLAKRELPLRLDVDMDFLRLEECRLQCGGDTERVDQDAGGAR